MARTKRKDEDSVGIRTWVSVVVVLVLVIIGVNVAKTISASEASVTGWVCVSDKGDDIKGNGMCSGGSSDDVPYRTISRAMQEAVSDGKTRSINVALEGPTYTLREPGFVEIGSDMFMRIGRAPISGDNSVTVVGEFTRFNARGHLEVNGIHFSDQSDVVIYASGKESWVDVYGNSFADRSHLRGFGFTSEDSGRMEISSNRFAFALGSSINNPGVGLFSKNGGMLMFLDNTVIQERAASYRQENWTSAISVATNLPDFSGHRYSIKGNDFFTLTSSHDPQRSDKEVGFHIVTNGDQMTSLERDNNFKSYLGVPVRREKS